MKSDVVDVEEAVAAAACSREIRLHHQLSIAAKFVGGQIIFISYKLFAVSTCIDESSVIHSPPLGIS